MLELRYRQFEVPADKSVPNASDLSSQRQCHRTPSVFGGVFLVAGGFLVLGQIVRSPYATNAGVIKDQPVPFSHAHHVGDDGIDCRYCHAGAETSSFAGLPPTQTCMNCHAYVWRKADALAPVHESYRTGEPIAWNRVNDLPDFVYFDHSIHVQKGVACRTCHGEVDTMPLMWRESTLLMEWCLACHRAPKLNVGDPKDAFATSRQLQLKQMDAAAGVAHTDWAALI